MKFGCVWISRKNSIVSNPTLLTIALVFLRLGSTAFGGPAAHIALMEEELVRRRKWLTHEQFMDLLGAANLIPGPNSTEMAIHIGYKMGGHLGLAIAGISFILPAFLFVLLLAALYERYGNVIFATWALNGAKPVIIAIILQAILNLFTASIKSSKMRLTALAVLILYLTGINEITLLFGSGLIASIIHFARSKAPREKLAMGIIGSASTALVAGTYLLASFSPTNLPESLQALFLYFLKIGSVLYGSGYVLLAFLKTDLVENYHWITKSQLLDAVAIGQLTPGPLFTTATFIGFLVEGPMGAVVATIGIFIPAFLLVATTAPLIERMRASKLLSQFMDAVNAAALALMAGVLYQLGKTALVDIPSVFICMMSCFILVRFKINSVWLILAGAVAGVIFRRINL